MHAQSNSAAATAQQTRKGGRAVGKIVQVIGPTLDVEFPSGQLPSIYNALKVENAARGIDLTCEVSLHVGDNVVRAIAMKSTDGLTRGMEVIDTGAPITVPVGEMTLGRIFNLLGEPIDQAGPVEIKDGPSRSPGERSIAAILPARSARCDAENSWVDDESMATIVEPNAASVIGSPASTGATTITTSRRSAALPNPHNTNAATRTASPAAAASHGSRTRREGPRG